MTVGQVIDLAEAVRARAQRDAIVAACCDGVPVDGDLFRFPSLATAAAAKGLLDKMCPRLRTGPVRPDGTLEIVVGPPLNSR